MVAGFSDHPVYKKLKEHVFETVIDSFLNSFAFNTVRLQIC